MDEKYPKGAAAGADGNATGGASTHAHTSPSHTHTMSSHTHTLTIAAATNYDTTSNTSSTGQPLGDQGPHTHAPYASGTPSSVSVSSQAATYGSVSNDPPFSSVIYITPTTDTSTLPSGVIVLSDSNLNGFNVCDGTSGTPNLVDKYLKGSGSGADAGTTGGSTTNTHALSHTHTTSHTHTASTSGGVVETGTGRVESGTSDRLYGGHTHSVSPNTATPSSIDDISLVTVETVEPAYRKLLAVKNVADQRIQSGTIALWAGALSEIPAGWIPCDGDNGTIDMSEKHLKITGTVGDVGSTGGSNTHTHGSQSHSHTISHTHTVPNISSHSVNINYRSSGAGLVVQAATAHTVSASTDSMTLETSSTTADSANNEPQFRTVIFIKLVRRIESASFIFNVIY